MNPESAAAGTIGIPSETLSDIPSPALLVDLSAVDANISRAPSDLAPGIRLRPHFKAHKCTRLLARQEAHTGHGVACQTVSEALTLAATGFADILVTNQVVDPHDLRLLPRIAESVDIAVVIDSHQHIALLERYLGITTDRTLGVLIEIDVGGGRAGLPPGSTELTQLADRLAATPSLEFRGLQAFEAHAVFHPDPGLRSTLVWQAAQQITHEKVRLQAAGHPVAVVSGGSSATAVPAAASGAFTEVQLGSYVLMDATYARLGLPFRNALWCVTSVVSRRGTAVTLNAGHKSLSTEYGLPEVILPGARVLGLADEHTRLLVPEDADLTIGDHVLLVPSHVDPTVNLHEVLHVWTGSAVETWPVDGRGSLRWRQSAT